jgi:hypothetical protein
MLQELHSRWMAPSSWVEFDDASFSVFEKRFPLAPRTSRMEWSEVGTIRAFLWDCFSSHVFGFRFVRASGESVCVDDMRVGWEQFRERVFERFPGIDKGAIAEVDMAFPAEAELCCWTAGSGEHEKNA